MLSSARSHNGDPKPPRYRLDQLALCVLIVCAAYVAALVWIDRGNGTFARLGEVGHLLALATLPVSASYLFRYWRWRWLLRRQGNAIPWWPGLAGYLAGFALTATPAKAGELMRLRYFARLGVPAPRTLAIFVFERASDLLIILSVSLLAAPVFPALGTLAAIVLGGVLVLFGAAAWPALLDWLARLGERLPGRWLRASTRFCLAAALELRSCLGLRSMAQSLFAGSLAWGLISCVFAGLCLALGLTLDPIVALGIYPLAMLVGAVSFVPGGVGTTELAIVLMLERLGVGTADAIAVAVAARLVTLWYAVVVGALALLSAELGVRREAD
ncbi:lysylphosphatidylglycerol synthase transmembrane domain-containing protein [Xanthomonas maliensis]|uniref:lysylphosphatidylglycerol synthase transmembrane domain-containing protein n=1 Tax=Xanthomonas maliensis TaxID=1321368 RepID=UPI0003B657CA|nr:lysylphosphatidylglycerol synthase transmembrane domain-containing protein [Xanthomonas maliensis]KAB7765811.1 lysylphosphatidylglycerol synthetase family protein [Xanthomonas maliensis]